MTMTSIPVAEWQTSVQPPPKRAADGGLIPLSKDTQLRPAEAMFRIWQVDLPGCYSIHDALEPALWRSVELFHREKHSPRASDLIRIIAADGDAIFKIEAVDRGYHLSLYCGQMPTHGASLEDAR
jgi:hypothetical protein